MMEVNHGKYIAIDIGGTAIKFGIIDNNGIILERAKMPTEAELGGPRILAKVCDIVRDCIQKEGPDAFLGICISSAGMVDCDNGIIAHAGPTIPSYKGTQFKKTLEERFGISTEIDNDVKCAGLAEYVAGAGRGTDSMVCLTVGTGIGGCAIVDGKVLRGHSGSAMEIGYLPIGFDGMTSFESLGATSVLTRKVQQAKDARAWADGELAGVWDGPAIFAAAMNGDKECISAIDEMCETLGRGIAMLCYVLNPEVVVLGGGVMAQEEYLKPRIRIALDKYLIPAISDVTEIKMATFQNDAGMLGAFYHFQQWQKLRKVR